MIVTAKIGIIEFVDDEVRVAVVKTGRTLPRVLEVRSVKVVYEDPADRHEAYVRALSEMLDSLRVQPTTYVLAVPCTKTIVRTLVIPFKGIARVSKAVPFELEPHLAFPLDELLLDFNIIQETTEGTEVLAIGIRRSGLEEQLAILEAVGVEAELAGVDAVGLTALWLATQKNIRGLRAVLHVRETYSVLAITYNKALAFFRIIHMGAQEIQEQLPRFKRDLQNTLRAFTAKWTGSDEISGISITGVYLENESLEELERTLGIPIVSLQVIDLLKGAKKALPPSSEVESANRWEAAIGVGYSAAGGGLPINLMRSTQQIHGAVRSVVAHLMFSACLALLALLGTAWYYHEGRLRTETLLTQVNAEISTLENEIESMAAEGLGEDVEFSIFSDAPLLEVLNEIAQRMPHDKVQISELRLSPPGSRGGWLEISGSTDNAAAFNAAFESLKQSTVFKVADDTNMRLQGERTTFKVRAFRPKEEISGPES